MRAGWPPWAIGRRSRRRTSRRTACRVLGGPGDDVEPVGCTAPRQVPARPPPRRSSWPHWPALLLSFRLPPGTAAWPQEPAGVNDWPTATPKGPAGLDAGTGLRQPFRPGERPASPPREPGRRTSFPMGTWLHCGTRQHTAFPATGRRQLPTEPTGEPYSTHHQTITTLTIAERLAAGNGDYDRSLPATACVSSAHGCDVFCRRRTSLPVDMEPRTGLAEIPRRARALNIEAGP